MNGKNKKIGGWRMEDRKHGALLYENIFMRTAVILHVEVVA